MRKIERKSYLPLVLIFCPLLFYAVPCLSHDAAVDTPVSILTLNYSDDDAGGNSVSVEANLGLPDGYRVTFGGGDDFTADYRTETKTSTYHVGMATNPDKPIATGIDYQQWGRIDSLTSETWRLNLDVRSDNWLARVSTELKTVHVFTTIGTQTDIDSNSYAINLGYYDTGKWFIDVGYKDIDYDKDIRDSGRYLYQLLLAGILSPETLQLLTTLDENQTTVTAGIDIGNDQLGIDWLSSEAVFESVSFTITSIYYDNVLSDHWSANLRFGRQKTDSSNISDLDIYSLSLSYIW